MIRIQDSSFQIQTKILNLVDPKHCFQQPVFDRNIKLLARVNLFLSVQIWFCAVETGPFFLFYKNVFWIALFWEGSCKRKGLILSFIRIIFGGLVRTVMNWESWSTVQRAVCKGGIPVSILKIRSCALKCWMFSLEGRRLLLLLGRSLWRLMDK